VDAFENLLSDEKPLIDRVIAFIARRHRLTPDEAEEFASFVYVKLIENDYKRLRHFRGNSTLRTYLTIVIDRLCLDFLAERRGKFRPSAEAKRQGLHAVLLERYMIRDGYSFEEACEQIRKNHGMNISDAEFERLRTVLPPRLPRQHVDDADLEKLPAPDADAESAAIQAEGQAKAARFWQALRRELAKLPAQDRLIIQMNTEQGLKLAQISRMLQIDQPRLYRRRREICDQLRALLEADGFTADDIDTYLSNPPPPDDEER
jgi:RNA polymerase sigma factor (sigma-70 family)